MFLVFLATTAAAPQTHLDELLARAKSLELDTPYVPPPGDPLEHHAAGYAKVMCTAVFMTGLAPDFAAARGSHRRGNDDVVLEIGTGLHHRQGRGKDCSAASSNPMMEDAMGRRRGYCIHRSL